MHRIDSRTVEYTYPEMTAWERFESRLDLGEPIMEAAEQALALGLERGVRYSREFIEHLSEGTLTGSRRAERTIRTAFGRSLAREVSIPAQRVGPNPFVPPQPFEAFVAEAAHAEALAMIEAEGARVQSSAPVPGGYWVQVAY